MIQELRAGEKEDMQLEHPFGRGINFQIDTSSVQAIIDSLLKNDYPLHRGIKECWRDIGVKGQECGSKEILVHDPDGYELRFLEDLGFRSV